MKSDITFTCSQEFKGLVPEPVPSSENFPEWFSNLKLDIKKCPYVTTDNPYDLEQWDANSVKKCVGIQDFLKLGYIIPSWGDFIFREQDNGDLFVNWMGDYFTETYGVHDDSQYTTLPNKPLYGHFGKFKTPWIIKTSPGISCLITHPVWHNNKSFTTATGVVHTDLSPIHLQWFFEWNYNITSGMSMDKIDVDNQIIKREEPLMLVIPFKRTNFNHAIQYISETEYNRLEKVIDSNLQDRQSECPYKKLRRRIGRLFS